MFRSLVKNSYGNIAVYSYFTQPRGCFLQYGNYYLKSTLYTSSVAFEKFNRNNNVMTSKQSLKNPENNLLHTNSVHKNMLKADVLDINKAILEFNKINMSDLKQAPLPAFWLGFGGLVPFVFPPLTSMIIGYSYFLTTCQLGYGIAILSFVGGIKWGYLINSTKDQSTWENYTLSIAPSLVAALAFIMPKPISFFLVIVGLLAAFAADLTSSRYPPWFISLRSVLTTIAVFSLFISMIQSVFH